MPLPPPLETLLTAGLETAINQLLKLDERQDNGRRTLQGKVIKLDIRELMPVWLVFSTQYVDVLAHYEGPADAGLSTTLSALPRLRDRSQLTPLIREGKVDLIGDPGLFNQFAILLGDLDIDWEGQLGRYIGQIPAHLFTTGLRKLQAGVQQQLAISRQDLAEYLVEELRLAPGPLEVADFCDDVAALRRQCDATALRLEKLAHRIGL